MISLKSANMVVTLSKVLGFNIEVAPSPAFMVGDEPKCIRVYKFKDVVEFTDFLSENFVVLNMTQNLLEDNYPEVHIRMVVLTEDEFRRYEIEAPALRKSLGNGGIA